jgi:hypothetical protein
MLKSIVKSHGPGGPPPRMKGSASD